MNVARLSAVDASRRSGSAPAGTTLPEPNSMEQVQGEGAAEQGKAFDLAATLANLELGDDKPKSLSSPPASPRGGGDMRTMSVDAASGIETSPGVRAKRESALQTATSRLVVKKSPSSNQLSSMAGDQAGSEGNGEENASPVRKVRRKRDKLLLPRVASAGNLSKTYPLPLDAEGNKIVDPSQLPTMLCLRKRQAVVVATAKKLQQAPPMEDDIRRQVLMRNTLKANAMRIEQVVEEQTKGKLLQKNAQREPTRQSQLLKPGQRMSAMRRARFLAQQRAAQIQEGS